MGQCALRRTCPCFHQNYGKYEFYKVSGNGSTTNVNNKPSYGASNGKLTGDKDFLCSTPLPTNHVLVFSKSKRNASHNNIYIIPKSVKLVVLVIS